jgi:cyclic beta-1,2-glucan synthetase
VSIGNSIGSLRALSAIDWRDFVEHTSIVDQFLREDPAGVYATMDFATRDDYRHVIESISRKHRLNEPEVAEAALALSRSDTTADNTLVSRHVGFYLIDKGRHALEKSLGVRPAFAQTMRRLLDRAPLPIYLGLLALLTFAFARALVVSASHNHLPTWGLIGIAIPSIILASQLAMSLLNWVATLTVPPRQLPRMDYSAGIPESARTMVVVPSLFGSANDLEELVEALEVRFLGNRDEQLHFALLTDFPMPTRKRCPAMRRCCAWQGGVSRRSTTNTPPQKWIGSSCSIVRAAGTPPNNAGWAASASAASWPTSTRCCAAARRRPASC